MRIAIDDFGTGYSNLAYLRHLPVHSLKLAGSFVAGLRQPDGADPVDQQDRRGGRSALAHALDLSVTAEGVETAEQADRLRALGCDTAQGWYYASSGPASAIKFPAVFLSAAQWISTAQLAAYGLIVLVHVDHELRPEVRLVPVGADQVVGPVGEAGIELELRQVGLVDVLRLVAHVAEARLLVVIVAERDVQVQGGVRAILAAPSNASWCSANCWSAESRSTPPSWSTWRPSSIPSRCQSRSWPAPGSVRLP